MSARGHERSRLHFCQSCIDASNAAAEQHATYEEPPHPCTGGCRAWPACSKECECGMDHTDPEPEFGGVAGFA